MYFVGHVEVVEVSSYLVAREVTAMDWSGTVYNIEQVKNIRAGHLGQSLFILDFLNISLPHTQTLGTTKEKYLSLNYQNNHSDYFYLKAEDTVQLGIN